MQTSVRTLLESRLPIGTSIVPPSVLMTLKENQNLGEFLRVSRLVR